MSLSAKVRLKKRWVMPILLLSAWLAPELVSAQSIAWHSWSGDEFTRASKEHKFVLLNLQNMWCHECRAMDRETYSDESVQRLMSKKYVAVKVDNNARPDISNRYWGYDLPATVIFNSDGNEIIRQQGYLSPRQMASLLQAVIDDPSPGPSVKPDPVLQYPSSPSISSNVLGELKKSFNTQYDIPAQGWAFAVRYIDNDSVEYAMALAQDGDKSLERQLREGLREAEQLLDPVWGGAYLSLVVPFAPIGKDDNAHFTRIQISGRLDATGESWNEPHFEKPLSAEAQTIQIYSEAYGRWHDSEYLRTAQNVSGYVLRFLTSPQGAFYAGQAGEVDGSTKSVSYFALSNAKRRAVGTPSVDTHLYARENAWMIRALCSLYKAGARPEALQDAERAARWVISNRSLPGGGYSHEGPNGEGPYLSDTVAMGQALLALYEVTGDRTWLARAEDASRFISKTFGDSSLPGFVTAKIPFDRAYGPHANREENAQLVRFSVALGRHTEGGTEKEVATKAMRYIATKEIADDHFSAPVLLAERSYTHTADQTSLAKK